MPEHDFPPRTDRRPLADADRDGARSPRQTRPHGVTTVRRWSNWSLAALVVGVAGGTAALARTIPSHSASTTTVVPGTATTGTVGTVGSAGAPAAPGTAPVGSGAPSAPKPIAVTSPSGVTTYVMPSGATGGGSNGTVPGAGVTYVARGDT